MPRDHWRDILSISAHLNVYFNHVQLAAACALLVSFIQLSVNAMDFQTAVNKGTQAMASGNFRLAAAAYNLALQKNPNSAQAHLCYANSLLKQSQTDPWNRADAVRHYQKVLDLDTQSTYSTEAATALAKLNAGSHIAAPSARSSNENIAAPETYYRKSPTQDPQKAFNINTGALPRIRKWQSPWLRASDIASWSFAAKASHLNIAAQQLATAKSWQESAEDNLRRAKSVTQSAIPNSRAYGQTEGEFQEQLQRCREIVDLTLQPYVADLEASKKAVTEAGSVYAMCEAAQRGY